MTLTSVVLLVCGHTCIVGTGAIVGTGGHCWYWRPLLVLAAIVGTVTIIGTVATAGIVAVALLGVVEYW